MSILFIFAIFWVYTAFGVPAMPFPAEHNLSGGGVIKIYHKGDEWLNWHETEDGYPLIFEAGKWYYAVLKNGALVSSGYEVGSVDPSLRGITRNIGKELVNKKRLLIQQAKGVRPPPAAGLKAKQVTRRILVIMVDFSDQAGTSTPDNIRAKFFGASGSVKHYFETVSGGNVNIFPVNENSGTPNDGVIGWVRMSGNHPECQDLSNSANINCHQNLARDAITQAGSFVNSSDFNNYDSNGDGALTPEELSVIIVVAGFESATSACKSNTAYDNRVWAHQYGFPTNPPTLGGKQILFYAMFGENHCIQLSGGGTTTYPATIGVMVHELGHLTFSLPDLYDTDGSSEGIGIMGLMGSGAWGRVSASDYPGSSPVYPSAWTRVHLGWLNPTTHPISSLQANVDLFEYTTSSANIIRVNTNSADEYFLLSYRSPKTGTYDEGLKGFAITTGGIAIYHVDSSKWPSCLATNDCNANESDKMVDFEEADGSNALDSLGGSITDDMFFSDVSGRNQFNSGTNPSSSLKGGGDSGVSITVVSKGTDKFTLDLTGGTPPSGGDGGAGGGGGGSGGCSAVSSNSLIYLVVAFLMFAFRTFRRFV